MILVFFVVVCVFFDGLYCLFIGGEWVEGCGCIIMVENLVCEDIIVEVYVVLFDQFDDVVSVV